MSGAPRPVASLLATIFVSARVEALGRVCPARFDKTVSGRDMSTSGSGCARGEPSAPWCLCRCAQTQVAHRQTQVSGELLVATKLASQSRAHAEPLSHPHSHAASACCGMLAASALSELPNATAITHASRASCGVLVSTPGHPLATGAEASPPRVGPAAAARGRGAGLTPRCSPSLSLACLLPPTTSMRGCVCMCARKASRQAVGGMLLRLDICLHPA